MRSERQRRRGLDLVDDDAGADPVDAVDAHPFLEEQTFEGGVVGDDDLDHVVGLPGQVVTLQHFGHRLHCVAKSRDAVGPVVRQRHVDEAQQIETDGLSLHDCRITLDDATGFPAFAVASATLAALHNQHPLLDTVVFSNQFLLAALNRVINAGTLAAARESKEILMNELGVIYLTDAPRSRLDRPGRAHGGTATAVDPEGDPALVSTEGTVDGGVFRFRAAHFEWLLRFGEPLGLGFADMGQRRHGTASTLFFCNELFRLYGSDDYNEAMGAAFAVENWAAAGFWKQLIAGLERVKRDRVQTLPLAFFTWHDRIEEQHRKHLWRELAECYHSPQFVETSFIQAGVTMLDGVRAFWDGLAHDRAPVVPVLAAAR